MVVVIVVICASRPYQYKSREILTLILELRNILWVFILYICSEFVQGGDVLQTLAKSAFHIPGSKCQPSRRSSTMPTINYAYRPIVGLKIYGWSHRYWTDPFLPQGITHQANKLEGRWKYLHKVALLDRGITRARAGNKCVNTSVLKLYGSNFEPNSKSTMSCRFTIQNSTSAYPA